MRIAIVDDEPIFSQKIAQILQQIGQDTDQITLYNLGLDLLADYRYKIQYDLVFLDIEMPGLNGIETAQDIKRLDKGSIIIILTRYPEYALSAFEARAFHFIYKPSLTIDKLKRVYWEAFEALPYGKNHGIVVNRKSDVTYIPLTHIYYIESFRNLLHIHTAEESFELWASLKKIQGQLVDQLFVKIHKSFVVNLTKVKFVNPRKRTLHLLNGVDLPISRTNFHSFMHDYLQIKGKQWLF